MAKRGNLVQVTAGKRLPPLKKQMLDVQNEIRKDLDKVAKAHQKSLERVVADWSASTKPTFKAKTVVTAQRIGVNITVKEANRDKPVWMWLDKTGTKPHKIPKRPKTGRSRLRFRTGYQAKTRPSPARYGGSGRATGPVVYARQVNHPGFPPRKFSEQINKDMRKEYNRAVRNGGRRGVRRALRRV
ncbi:MAG: hypothetical protein GY743_23340 [Planctomycetaceae bacterium]|nr:hypothetical protein [Planctomycetaceae bacterium]